MDSERRAFPIKQYSLPFVLNIEKQVKKLLSAHVVKGPSSKIEVIGKEVNDDGVQWHLYTTLSRG